jgi:hypothetical protein
MTRTATTSMSRATLAPPRDLRRFWRISIALLLPLGPLGITIGRALMPYWTDQEGETIVRGVLENPGSIIFSAWFGLIMFPSMLVGVLTLGYLARRAAPVLATIGTIVTFLAYANWGAAGNSDFLTVTLGAAEMDVATIVRINEVMLADPLATVAGINWILGHIVGTVLLSIAIGKARVVNRWVAVGLAVSQPIHLVAAVILPSRWLDVTLGWGLTTVCFALISVAILRMSNEQWDVAPLRAVR